MSKGVISIRNLESESELVRFIDQFFFAKNKVSYSRSTISDAQILVTLCEKYFFVKKYLGKMTGSPAKKLRMYEDDLDYDDIDIESESGGECDSDNEDEILEVDDHEGKELLKNFLEINSVGGWNEPTTGIKVASVENDKCTSSLETNKNSVAVTDFVLDDVKKVNEENLRLLEEVQEILLIFVKIIIHDNKCAQDFIHNFKFNDNMYYYY